MRRPLTLTLCSDDHGGSGLSWQVHSAGPTADRKGELLLNGCFSSVKAGFSLDSTSRWWKHLLPLASMWEIWTWTRRRLWRCGMSGDRRAWDPTGGKDNTDVHPDDQVLLSDSQLFFRYYLEDCKVLVFVVDSSDRTRMPEAQKVLKEILVEEKLTNVPLMVLANKKDLPNSMTIREVKLKLSKLKPCFQVERKWPNVFVLIRFLMSWVWPLTLTDCGRSRPAVAWRGSVFSRP